MSLEDRLREILEENYYETREECKRLTVKYISQTKSVKDKDAVFIKLLTKVANNILTESDDLDSRIQRIYNFNLEGIKNTIQDKQLPDKDKTIMISHFNSYAADSMKKKYFLTQDLRCAKKWYQKLNESVKKDPDIKHATYTLGFKAEAAQKIYENTKGEERILWAKRWYYARKKCAEQSLMNFDIKHSAYSHSFSGNAAKELYNLTNDKKWAINWFKEYGKSAILSESINPKHSAYSYGHMGDAAIELGWKNTAKNCYTVFLEYLKKDQYRTSDLIRKIEEKIKKIRI